MAGPRKLDGKDERRGYGRKREAGVGGGTEGRMKRWKSYNL
jgi:hypothetical protein